MKYPPTLPSSNVSDNISDGITFTSIDDQYLHELEAMVSSEPAFLNYYNTLCENRWRVNAISEAELQKGFDHFINFHIIDALVAMNVVEDWRAKRLLDIGSGAGLPGIPLYIIRKEQLQQAILIDSKKKKTELLNIIAAKLKLNSIIAHNMRAEEASHAPEYREMFDIVTTRAVGGIGYSIELMLPYVKPGGLALLYAGVISQDIVEFSTDFSLKLGGKLENIVNYLLKDAENVRNIMVFKKIESTSNIYPRKASKLGK